VPPPPAAEKMDGEVIWDIRGEAGKVLPEILVRAWGTN
jgi:hypothetical protein